MSTFTIGDCVSDLPNKGAGRTNWGDTSDGSIGTTAVVEAIKALTESLELEELKYVTPIPPQAGVLSLTAGVPTVTIATLLATIPGNALYPQFNGQNVYDVTDFYTSWLWFAPGVNNAGRSLEYRRITTLDMYTYGVTSSTANVYGVAPPVYYSRFGSSIIFGPNPDQNYNFFIRMKLRHPFPATDYADQVVFMPDSWQEAVERSAIVKLASNEGITDSSIYKTNMDWLTANGVAPAQLRQMQMLRDEKHSSRSLSVRVSRYSHG